MTIESYPKGCAFVLGGSGQLGQAICRAFARVGVPVAFSYHTGRAAGEEALAELRKSTEAEFYPLDGRDRAAVGQVLARVAERFGAIHSVVYAGGSANFTPEFFSRTDEAVWKDWLQNDLLSAINLGQACIPYLRDSKGAFTALSTYQCRMIEVRGSPSVISKAAVDAMVRAIAKEEGRYGVRANTVQAGWYAVSGVLKLFELMPDLEKEKRRTIPLGRIGAAEELGETVAFLSSRRAGFITGVNLTADGGESL